MILERLKQYIDLKGLTVAAFERSIGMANASFGKSLKKGGGIGTDKLENILTIYPDISPMWLLRGVGEMLLPDPEHPEKQHQAAPSFLLDMIKEKDQIIREQSEELGQLREQLAQARRKIEQLRSEKNENIIAQVHTQTAPAVAP